MPNLTGSVGLGGKNARPDVTLVQQLLNAVMPPGKIRLAQDGLIGPKTLGALADFQRLNGLGGSGLIHPGDATWQKLNAGTGGVATRAPQVPIAAPSVGPWPAKFTFDQFWNFTEPLEGGHAADCMFMVQDLQVATGMGITFTNKANRNEGLARALKLHWVFKPGHPRAGQRCDPADITRDYDAVLDKPSLGRQGPGHLPEWMAATACRITREGLRQAVKDKITTNLNYAKTMRKDLKYLGDFDRFPADAQLCVASLTWAIGNEFGFPNFCRACREGNWFAAAKECTFSSKENTLPRRQEQQQLMMHNAGCAALGVADPEVLHFPGRLILPAGPQGPREFRDRHIEISTG